CAAEAVLSRQFWDFLTCRPQLHSVQRGVRMPGFRFLRETVIGLGWASSLSHRDLRILLAMRSASLIAAAILLGAGIQPAAVAIGTFTFASLVWSSDASSATKF